MPHSANYLTSDPEIPMMYWDNKIGLREHTTTSRKRKIIIHLRGFRNLRKGNQVQLLEYMPSTGAKLTDDRKGKLNQK